MDTWHRSVPVLGRLTLPLPDPLARTITRLEGALFLTSESLRTEFRLPPESVGQTFSRDGISIAVRYWKRGGQPGGTYDANALDVQMGVTYQPLRPPGDFNPYQPGHDAVTAVLLAPDGDPVQSTAGGFSGKEGHMQLEFCFPLVRHVFDGHAQKTEPPIEPEAVLVTVTRVGLTDRTVPFVFTNLPLP